MAQSGSCAGVSCQTSPDDPCASDFCDPATGQCTERILDAYSECLTANAPGLCLGGVCEQIGDECNGEPCESTACTVAACRLPCTYKPTGCTPNDFLEETPECFITTRPDGALCDGQPGTCFLGVCAFGPCANDAQCEDGNPCTINYCDPFGQLCDTSGALPVADGTPCVENVQGQVLALCENGVCLPDLCIGRDCSDGNSCTQDICTPPYGICSNPNEPNGTTCVGGGQCLFGNCQPILPTCGQDGDCDDGNSCTADTCPAGVCDFDPLPNGAPCIGENGQCLLGSCIAGGL